MAELANTLATSHDHEVTLYTKDITSSPQGNVPRHQSKNDASIRDRDSGVFLSDGEDVPTPPTTSRPLSTASLISLKHTSSVRSGTGPHRADSTARRLCRPAELNLGSNATSADPNKPKSELERRYDLIRNSQNKSKAALKSPTQLLQDRLNFTPMKGKHQEKIHTFTPPQPMLNGCILPGPAAQMQAFTGSSVRARTEKTERPAWWCKVDKVVVFDGAEETEGGKIKYNIRTSKGLTIARRRGDNVTVVIPLDCGHCQEMLNRHEWKYDVQVCKRVGCWDCRERCKWELEQETTSIAKADEATEQAAQETNRERADSVLQDERVLGGNLKEKGGIESEIKTLCV